MFADSPARALVPTMLRLAGPVALARLGWMGMGVTDTIVVGQIAPHQLAFLALGWAPTGVLLVTGMGLLAGVQVLAARAVGQGRPETAGAVWREGMIVALAAGLVAALLLGTMADALLRALGVGAVLADGATGVARVLALSLPFQFTHNACSSFLEAIKRPAAGAIIIWIANGINLALNLFLVPHLGAMGAAWSTFGARGFMITALLTWIWFSPTARAHGARQGRVGAHGYGALFTVGSASAVSQLAEAGAFNALSVIAARVSAEAVAAYQILLNVLAVVFMVALGFSSAAAVLVSEAHGRRDARGEARAGWTALALNSICMGLCSLILFLGAGAIARAFTSDASLAALIAGLLPLCVLIVFPDGGQTVMAQALRGRGDNWFPSGSHVASYIFVMPPLAYLLGERMGRGVVGLMEAIVIASAVSFLVLAARFAFLARHTPSTQPSSRSTI